MSASHQHPHLERLDNPGPLHAPRATMWSLLFIAAGLISFLAMLGFSERPERPWAALLQGLMIPTWISLGAMFFIAVHSLGNAHWTVPIRRVMEGLAGGIPLGFAGFIVLALCGLPYLYEWASAGDRSHLFHAHDGQKSEWMTSSRFIATTGVIFAIWWWFQFTFRRLSILQDGRADISVRHVRWSVVFLLVFALTFTLFVWDLLLSLQLHFVSAMWGIYCIVGAVQMFLAVLALSLVVLGRGPLKDVVRPHILHDLGTWTVAWACIWAYIAYAQYVIVYYANMNEESYFYLMRTQHGYGAYYAIESVLRFPIPFLALLSFRWRTDPRVIVAVAVCVLLGGWFDLSWIIMPAIYPNETHYVWALPELMVGAGFSAGLVLMAMRFWKRHGLIPQGDPRLLSSINAEHMH
ncbi:MAG: hypothetical protein H0V44_09480 [Planctomycetes bacterium]|nr:hypothetical protein [Planctomycetota bacterium]